MHAAASVGDLDDRPARNKSESRPPSRGVTEASPDGDSLRDGGARGRRSRRGADEPASGLDLRRVVHHDGHVTEIRPARPADAEGMAEVQNAIYRAGLRASPVDVALVHERYLDPNYGVACTVAEQEGRVVGFQSLKRAWPGNP